MWKVKCGLFQFRSFSCYQYILFAFQAEDELEPEKPDEGEV